jgi:hypothetical protein
MRAYECREGVGGKVARPVAPPIATKAAMGDGLLDWAYHSNHTLPSTAAVSLVAANRQLVQAVGGFGLCFFGQHFALTVLLLQSLRVLAGPAARGLHAEVSRALEAVPPMQEQEARAVLTKADAQLLKVKASAGEARSALQAGTLDMAAATKLLASAAADARALATEVATAHATLSRLSAFASAVDPAALHGGLAALGAAAAAAWGAVVRSSAGEVLSGATLGSDTAALLGRLATPALEVLHEAHLATTATRDDEPGGWSAWLHATRSESVDGPKEEAPTEPSASPYFFGGLAAVAAGYLQLPPHERRWADAALHATAALLGFLFMRRAKARRLYAAFPVPPHQRCRHAASLLPPLQPSRAAHPFSSPSLMPSLRRAQAAAATCAAAALGATLVVAAARESGVDALLFSAFGEAPAAAEAEAGVAGGVGAEGVAAARASLSDYAQAMLVVAGLAFQLLQARLPFLVRLLLWPILAFEAWLQAGSAAALAAHTHTPATPTGTAAPALPPPANVATGGSGGGRRAAMSPARARPKAE